MKVLKARPITKERYKQLSEDILTLGITPSLTVVLIGEDPAASYYVQNLVKFGLKYGIEVNIAKYDTTITQAELLTLIEELNESKKCHGIMLQKPLPSHIDEDLIVNAISPNKDVDGFHPYNLGNLFMEQSNFVPCTPAAVLEMLEYYEIETSGKHIAIVGRSNIVGKPLANLFLRKNKTGNATVTVCHSRTTNLSEITRQADILVAAIGKANFIDSSMIKKGAVIIDVGINEVTLPDGKKTYVGDVAYDECSELSSAITPVPGGIGSLTTYNLLKNVYVAARLNNA
ncbi:MAG: tetrahydrofolate dehydrogenase/cyclohydrolase catalytic domain-containing protein [Candidatus Zophobacter franzmannii]|nr:tetrahydrofolate dehydrogenase/cyclohydrolase catalytic domain-containing protein [Candidatus Zophobacter franzmannii]